MLKALIKKELGQLRAVFFSSRKTGKPLSGGAIVGLTILFVFVFISLCAMFYGISQMLCSAFVGAGGEPLYFSTMALLTLAFGLIGNVFTAHSILFKAKDNELLLSMPIPPSRILLVRMLVVYGMSLIVCAIVWIPTLLAYAMQVGFFTRGVVFRILLLFLLAALVTVLSCFLGWLVALATRRIRNKSLATVLFSLLFIGAYYYVYFRMNSALKALIANSGALESGLKSWGWPIWQIGLACTGKALPMLIVTLITAALFMITCVLLSASIIRIMTSSDAVKKAIYHEKKEKLEGVDRALLKKELKRFSSSPIYMLNSGIGLLMLVAAAVAALVYMNKIREIAASMLPAQLAPYTAIAALGITLLIASTVIITAPSVSLEGKSLWIIQSMPVEPARVLKAKERLQLVLAVLPVLFTSIVLCVVLRLPALVTALIALCSVLFVWLSAAFGLMMNVLKPNFDWTNEAVPIKQGMPVLLTMCFGWIGTLLISLLGYFLMRLMDIRIVLVIIAVIETFAALIIDRWISTAGARIFSKLS